MSKLFFDHLIDVSRLKARIIELELAENVLRDFEVQIDKLIQQRVVEVVLDLIDEDHHEIFVAKLHKDPGSKEILLWLKQLVKEVEDEIVDAINELESELIEEMV